MITVSNLSPFTSIRSSVAVTQQMMGNYERSKLKHLVPSVGVFFTPLELEAAFIYQDNRRYISSRHFVAPSFNDIRLILNTAQIMSLVKGGSIKLVTFDGDVTLYDDGEALTSENPVIPRIIKLLEKGICVGIVTAAGYTEASKYRARLYGLLEAVRTSTLTDSHKRNLVVLGGECNFLFGFDSTSADLLSFVPRDEWALDEMKLWTEEDVTELLDIAQDALRDCVANMRLPADLLRKERAVGIIPTGRQKLAREQLEETVLVAQRILERSAVGKRLPFCAFNGEWALTAVLACYLEVSCQTSLIKAIAIEICFALEHFHLPLTYGNTLNKFLHNLMRSSRMESETSHTATLTKRLRYTCLLHFV